MAADSVPPDAISTMVELLRWRAEMEASSGSYTFLSDENASREDLSYQELHRQAQAIAGMLRSHKVTGQPVLLIFPSGLEYIAALFGCWYAGALATPIYPPLRKRSLPRLQSILESAQPRVGLTTRKLRPQLEHLFANHAGARELQLIEFETAASGPPLLEPAPDVTAHAPALLQYTSGSIADPNGVVLTHHNLLCNQRIIQAAFGHNAESVVVGWLPLYHDMGLIGNVLQSLYMGLHCVLMSPVEFLQNPLFWLRTISAYGATTSGGPNFAYEHCVRQITSLPTDLDLSRWQVAFCGAEPIRSSTLDRFAQKFGPSGFRRDAFFPCYGLAEATLMVTSRRHDRPLVTQVFESKALEHNQLIETPLDTGRTLVSCGQSLLDGRVVIVDPDSHCRIPDGQIGEIWIAGDSVGQGYWNRPDDSASVFRARSTPQARETFLRTGDLGVHWAGELFVTGRLKELLVIRGRNYYPQDIERCAAESHPDLRYDSGAAFSVEVQEEERLVVVQELGSECRADTNQVIESIRTNIGEEHEIDVFAVVLVRRMAVPRTSSGKIRRQKCRELFLQGKLSSIAQWCRKSDSGLVSEERLEPADQSPEAVTDWLCAELGRWLDLKANKVAPDLPIQACGLDSIGHFELLNSIEERFGVRLSWRDLSGESTLQDVGTRIARLAVGPRKSVDVDSRQNGRSVFPLSYHQRSIWYDCRQDSFPGAYHIARAVRVYGRIKLATWRDAFQFLVDRHPALRTGGFSAGNPPVQHVTSQLKVRFEAINASGWSSARLIEELNQRAKDPFDLDQDASLFRVRLYTRSPHEQIMLLVVHHIVADFWSLELLVGELQSLLVAMSAGRPWALSPLRADYAGYVHWQEQLLAGPEGVRLLNFWRGRLAGLSCEMDLPADHARPLQRCSEGRRHDFQLSADLSDALQQLSRGLGTSLHALLLAAFQVLLSGYTDEDEFAVISPAAGRTRAEFADTIGYFVNPVVHRADLKSIQSFDQLVSNVHRAVLEALECQDFPFALLIERLRPQRETGRIPFFRAMFNFLKARSANLEGLTGFALNREGSRVDLGPCVLECLPLEATASLSDLGLSMGLIQGSLAGVFEYQPALFRASTIAQMATSYQNLLASITRNPHGRLCDVQLELQVPDRRETANETQLPQLQSCKDMVTQFAHQAASTPDRIALIAGEKNIRYAELNTAADAWADRLIALGVGPETPVGVCVERSADAIVALLAVLKAGGAYVPLDPSFPRERLRFILSDTGAKIVLAHRKSADCLPDMELQCLYLDEPAPASNKGRKPGMRAQTDPDRLAYIMYTSGSTGLPKGVAVTHRGVVRLVKNTNYADFDASQVFLQLAPLSFDASTLEIWGPLLNGGRLVVMPPGTPSPEELGAALRQHGVTTLWLTAELFHRIVDRDVSLLDPVRQLLAGGDVLSVPRVRRVLERRKAGGVLINGYGPTEGTTFTCCCRMSQPEEIGTSVPIGRPISNTRAYILDKQMRPAPVGVNGELYIAGDGLARGYVNEPALTAEKFVPNPFAQSPGERLYRTGDLAQWLADGRIEFLGRTDFQVKIRGFRVEPGEVESALQEHPDLQAAAVIARADTNSGKRLAAYIVPVAGRSPAIGELRQFLGQRMPDYMIPSAFVFLDSLPLNNNGKVDRAALPLPVKDEGGWPPATAKSPEEAFLLATWKELLAVPEVGIQDNFFELGGHSLLADQLICRIRDTFHVQLPTSTIFQYPRLADFCEAMIAYRQDQARICLPPISKRQKPQHDPVITWQEPKEQIR